MMDRRTLLAGMGGTAAAAAVADQGTPPSAAPLAAAPFAPARPDVGFLRTEALVHAERAQADGPRGAAHTAFDAWAAGAADPVWEASDAGTSALTVTPRPPTDGKHGIHGSHKTRRMPGTAASASPVVVRRRPSRKHYLAASGEYVTPRQVAVVLADVRALPPLRFGRFG